MIIQYILLIRKLKIHYHVKIQESIYINNFLIIIKSNKTEEEFKISINKITTEVLNHIEKERFVENILSIKISKAKKQILE